ncbi:conserved hypothetical protein [Culex quinquefasciatus]|uniref:Uncharacterized protein n=1 Tax=Culex quinquefasciatus TaxID=7176 RepID=B0X9T9_CULQU|nr:conserved hypothetical protein [Culex quinquefasciatus]EDS43294.1 conserved hypothetical protein [Culex quinquefasciatus]EDS43296.1 conserved hypothetical protein [Culex quinquefasciatus]|eukprot:XP_001866411.1 conserved hypothetical protein [Culex quinquefasciatus]
MTRRKKPRNRNRDALLYDKDDDKPNEMLDHKLAEDRARKHRRQGGTRATSVTKFKNFFFDEPETSSEKKSSASRDRTSDIKKPKLDKDQDQEEDEERKRKPVTYKPTYGIRRWPWEFALSPRKGTVEEAMTHYDLDDVAIVEDAEQPPTYELSGSDTEKEIEWVKQKQREQTKNRSEVYDKSTEEEEGRIRKRFLLDDDVGAVDVTKLERLKTLVAGTIDQN